MVKYTNMGFDLTKPVLLDEKNYRLYRRFQLILYILAFFSAVYFSYLILFPHQYFTFSFLNPNSNRNTLEPPKLSEQALVLNTPLVGDYSRVKISAVPSQDLKNPDSMAISARKAYQAFLYDNGEPIGFKNGSLLENNGNFYIISDSQLKKFESRAALSNLGYAPENFKPVSEPELQYNYPGTNIKNGDFYPEAAIFKITEDYYILENQKLKKFVSAQAFLTGYDASQVIEKNPDFLRRYPISDELAGFADGTLATSKVSVHIISRGNLLPINEPATFENKGYRWEDLIYASADELALYEKGDLFEISNPHPDGTIFKTEDSQYFIILNQEKRLLPSKNIVQSWLKKSPILVSKESPDFSRSCNFKKDFLFRSYSCQILLEDFKNLIEPEYELRLTSIGDIKLDTIDIDYAKNIGWKNLRIFLTDLLNKIRLNYGLLASNQ